MSDTDRGDGPASATGGAGWTGGMAGNPSEQITQSLQSVSAALKSASEKVAASSQEVGLCALKQAERNTQALFETLRAMAATKSPKEVGELYAGFVNDSAKAHADQLREMGELLARTSREVWAPVTEALSRQNAG